MIEWISVKDRLPKPSSKKQILVITKQYDNYRPIYQVQAVLKKGGKLFYKDINVGDYMATETITHWAEINLPTL